ncbi:MAG TPA: PepSY domain-containing protein [Steroidobacteraceae bacterium]|nr:PepSY domain-containing protein [Steroidobacteraceae bacterium]
MALVVCAGMLLARAQESAAPASRVAVNRTSPRRAELSMAQAVRLAQRRFRARVVRAETRTQGDRTIYVLRMLDDAGRVFAVRVDAVSGAIL